MKFKVMMKVKTKVPKEEIEAGKVGIITGINTEGNLFSLEFEHEGNQKILEYNSGEFKKYMPEADKLSGIVAILNEDEIKMLLKAVSRTLRNRKTPQPVKPALKGRRSKLRKYPVEESMKDALLKELDKMN